MTKGTRQQRAKNNFLQLILRCIPAFNSQFNSFFPPLFFFSGATSQLKFPKSDPKLQCVSIVSVRSAIRRTDVVIHGSWGGVLIPDRTLKPRT